MSQGLGSLAVVFTRSGLDQILSMVSACEAAARGGGRVAVFFRDESIPLICLPAVADRLLAIPGASAAETSARGPSPADRELIAHHLNALASINDVHLYACSSSLYIWGVSAGDLLPAIKGARGLVAFLAEDLASAERVLTF